MLRFYPNTLHITKLSHSANHQLAPSLRSYRIPIMRMGSIGYGVTP